MSATVQADSSAGGTLGPSSKTVRRLTVETGKYLGVDTGDEIPVDEVRLQAEAHGYTDTEIEDLLDDAGLDADTVEVPPEGKLFGEIWQPDYAAGVPGGDPSTQDDPAVEIFDSWLEGKVDDDETKHSYSRRKANERFAKSKDVGRRFVDECDTFSTVQITYCADRQPDESIPEHAGRFYPEAVTRKRRRIMKGLGVWKDFAGLSLLAPKHGPRVPEAKTTMSHAHDFYWLPGEVSRSDFEGLIELHKKHVEGATDENNPLDDAVSVRTHTSADVSTPEEVAHRGQGKDAERGETTALPHEVGNNLPLLKTDLDARGLPEYAEKWCAELCLAPDGDPTSGGVSRIKKWGQFDDLADEQRWKRRLRKGAGNAGALTRVLSW